MATRSSVLAWRIPWTEGSGRLQSVGSQSQTGLKQLSMHTHTQWCAKDRHILTSPRLSLFQVFTMVCFAPLCL